MLTYRKIMAKKRSPSSKSNALGVRKSAKKNKMKKKGTKSKIVPNRNKTKSVAVKTRNKPNPTDIEKIIKSGDESTKRVSFAPKLASKAKTGEKKSLNDEIGNEKVATPLKPILKRRSAEGIESRTTNPKKKKLRIQAEEENSKELNISAQAVDSNREEDGEKKATVSPKRKAIRGKADKNAVRGKSRSEKLSEKLNAMSRKERKEYIRRLRAERKPHFELATKAKKLWEKIRRKRTTPEERKQLADEMYSLVEGKVVQLIYAHDTVRIIQCLMALKDNSDLRSKLFDEVKNEIIQMSKSKYAKFFVIKMLKYGTPAQREYVMQCFYGKVPQLLKHSKASEVLEYAYDEYANALQRSRIISEFYSTEFALWKVDEVLTLEKIIEKEPQRKGPILDSMKAHIIELSTKPVLRHSLVHRLVKEYFDHCTPADRKEIIDSLKERVVEMVHTKDGAICSMRCIWYGTVKERKMIVRTFKSLVTKMACEEYGHLVLLAVFDTVEASLVQKVILKEIKNHFQEIINNKYGMKVLHYLLKPRCPKHFLPPVIALLSEGDSLHKEDQEKRRSELLAYISPVLLSYCTDNMKELVTDAHSSLLALSILENAIGDKTDAYRSLCVDVLADEFIPMNMEGLHGIELPHSHLVVKKLIQNDKILSQKGEKTFSETVVDELTSQHFLSWMSCNRGMFILVYLYETDIDRVVEVVKSVVTSNHGRKKLKQYSFPAAKILSEKSF